MMAKKEGSRARDAAQFAKDPDSQPKDISHYDFVLRQSIDGTNDSLDLGRQDPAARTAVIAAKQARSGRRWNWKAP